jgi:hypothetical protein
MGLPTSQGGLAPSAARRRLWRAGQVVAASSLLLVSVGAGVVVPAASAASGAPRTAHPQQAQPGDSAGSKKVSATEKLPLKGALIRPHIESLPDWCTASAGVETCTPAAGQDESLTVPSGVTVNVTLEGAVGGSGGTGDLDDTSAAGNGGEVTGTFVSDGNPLTIAVGDQGGSSGAGSFTTTGTGGSGGWPDGAGGSNGGSAGTGGGCGGGGSTSISDNDTLLGIAGGGGGCGGDSIANSGGNGGNGGGDNGDGGTGSESCPGGGGYSGNNGGGGGTAGCGGGSGGASGGDTSGGQGGSATTGGGGAGGGGGGEPGGGGGGGAGFTGPGGGGGGGESAAPGLSGADLTSGDNAGGGFGSIWWDLSPTSTTLTNSSLSTDINVSTTLSASVETTDSSGYVPTGTVDFLDTDNGDSLLCSDTLNGSGEASCPYTPSASGNIDFEAVYEGDQQALTSTSGGGTITVSLDPTNIDPPNLTEVTSTEVNLSTTVYPASYSPSGIDGTVEFLYSTEQSNTDYSAYAEFCSDAISGNEGSSVPAGCTDQTLPAGSYSFEAEYEGDSDNAAVTSTAVPYSNAAATTTSLGTLAGTISYGQTDTLTATVSGIPGGDSNPGTVEFESYEQDGDVLTPEVDVNCVDGNNPASLDGSEQATCTVLQDASPAGYTTEFIAVYSGDYLTQSSTSSPQSQTVSQTATGVDVSVAASGGNTDVGVPIGLTATVTNSESSATPSGGLTFYQDGSAIGGCDAISSSSTTGDSATYQCADAPVPANLDTLDFTATYCPSDASNCSNWLSETSSETAYTPDPDPTSTSLTGPATSPGGNTASFVAAVSDTAGNAVIDGTVSFTENGDAISACTGMSLTDDMVTCTYTPTVARNDTIVATYNAGTLTATSTSNEVVVGVGSIATSTAVAVSTGSGGVAPGGEIDYAVPVTFTATVTSAQAATVTDGTVSFEANGEPMMIGGSPVCQAVDFSSKSQTASCTVSALDAGTYAITASFNPSDATYSTSTSPLTDDSWTIGPASTATSLQVTVNASNLTLTATVSNASTGSVANPAGTVDFAIAGGATLAGCGSIALVSGSTGLTASCTIATPTNTTFFSATFNPATVADVTDFQTSTGYDSYGIGSTCTGVYDDLWSQAGSTIDFAVGSLGGSSDRPMSVDAASESSPCAISTPLPFTKGTLSLFEQTLTGSDLSGSINGDTETGVPQLCFTGGSISLPSKWGLGSITLSSTVDLCAAITEPSADDFVLGLPVTANFKVPGITLPFGSADASVTYELLVSITGSKSPSLTATIQPSTTPPSGVPYVDATITATLVSGVVSVTGSLTASNLPFGALNATFSVSGGSGGTIAGTVTATIPGPWTPKNVPGLSVSNITVTFSSGSGLTFSGTATLGSSSQPLTLAVSGGYSAGTFSLDVTSGVVTWPLSSLTINATFSGTVTITTAGVVTFDVEAGTAPTAQSTPSAVVAWDPVSGLAVDVYCLELSYGVVPNCNGGADQTPGDPTLSIVASVTVGPSSSGMTLPIDGSFDLSSGAFSLSLDPSFGSPVVPVASGFTLTVTSLSLSGTLGSTPTFTASASADITSLGETVTATITNAGGTLIIAVDGISLPGVPVTGFFAYASAAVPSYATGDATFGTVSLAPGFNAFVVYTVPQAVSSALKAIGFSAGATVTFTATWDPGSSPTLTLTLAAPSGFFLPLPDGGSITGATLSWASNELSLDVTGTIPVPDESGATVGLTIMVNTGTGAVAGTATITGLTVFGQAVTNFGGSFSWSSSAGFTVTITGAISGQFAPFSSIPGLEFSGISFTLGTGGLTIKGDMSIDGLTTISLNGSFTSLQNWSISLAVTPSLWQPAPDITINGELTGSITDTNGAIGFSLTASGSPLLSFTVSGVTVSVDSVAFGDSGAPSTCSLSKDTDLYMTIAGSVSIDLGGVSGDVDAGGCFDLTADSFTLSASMPSFSISVAGGDVSITDAAVTLAESGGKLSATVSLAIVVSMPSGGQLSTTVSYTEEPNDNFVVGGSVSLGDWFGKVASGYVYYASQAVTDFDTGDGTASLGQGLNIVLDIQLSAAAATDLGNLLNTTIPSGYLLATATLDFQTSTYTLEVSVSFDNGIQLFDDNGTTLDLTSGDVFVQISDGVPSFGLSLNGDLHIPSPGSGDSASSVPVAGTLAVGTSGITASVSIGNCSDPSDAWNNAFGDTGLTVLCATVGGGITWDPAPGFTIFLSGTITGLPSSVSQAIGYNPSNASPGPPISFAFDLDPFLVSFSIGTKDSTTVALEPLEAYNEGTLIEVNYASLYIAPTPAVIGTTTYPAGISFAFQGTISGTAVDVFASIGFAPPSIDFQANIGSFSVGSLTVNSTSIDLQASTSPLSFSFTFSGGFTLGPGSVTLLPGLLQVGGSLSLNATVGVSTSGFTVLVSGSLYVDVWNYQSDATCWEYVIFPYPCDWQWNESTFSVTINPIGISVTGSGITFEGDGYSVTFNWSGGVSVSGAALEKLEKQACAEPGAADMAPSCAKVDVTGLGPAVGTWSATGKLKTDQTFAAVANLPGGDVLMAGGIGSGNVPTAAAEIFDPATNAWQPATSMPAPRAGAVTEVLANHDLLVAGGVGAKGAVLSSAVLYNPSTGEWSSTGSMPFASSFGSGVLLKNGDVMVAGGAGANHVPMALAAFYNPTTGTWTKLAPMSSPRLFAAAAVLSSGNVLVAGGTAKTALNTSEIFDPSTGKWSAAASLPHASDGISAVTLDSGIVLVVGDGNNSLLYNSASNTWTQTGGSSAPWADQRIVKMSNGDVLAVGGESHQATSAQVELYIPTLGRWQSAGTLPEASEGAAVALLKDGKILVAGGAHAVGVSDGTVKSFAGDSASELFSYPAPWTGKAASGFTGVKAGSTTGLYIGGDDNVWYLTVTQTSKKEGVYSGTITLNLGSFTKVERVDLEKADQLHWKGGTIWFTFTNYGDLDAVEFDVPAAASDITFNLELNGKPATAGHIFLGEQPYGNPDSNPFNVDRA